MFPRANWTSRPSSPTSRTSSAKPASRLAGCSLRSPRASSSSDSLRIGALFHAIRALGVKIAFDDFGTGYSSLNYLAAYPVDLVKIDQYFVQRMSKSYVHTEIVQLIVHLARTIGMSVSAEGVERSRPGCRSSRLGCNIAQGYLYSPPVPLTS